MTDPENDRGRPEDAFPETGGEDAQQRAPGDDPVASRPWSGYASDQGEPGDIEELEPPVAGTPGEDGRVRRDVCSQLAGDPSLDVPDVDVEVVRGEVVLQGSVGSEDVRRRVEVLARGVPRVRAVRNELEVRAGELEPPGERGRAA
jgi:hypothetical protein